mmetsp:Transcript_59515/g.191508  ORF Transcript_59515/g.191508 Transcript_59515/m.191508 type:complete len:426 (+) Transcript_59515:146-1423(+)
MQPQSSPASQGLQYSLKAWEEAAAGRAGGALQLASFELGRTIGQGRFARVRVAKLPGHGNIPLCLKILKKKDMCRLGQVEHVINEKNVLATTKHPLIIQLLETFQDPQRLYMALELVNGGELFNLLRSEKRFRPPKARFYIAEVASAIDHLHEMLIVYRDIKPENILIHHSGHIKLTDFGFAKFLKGQRTYTVCGTPAYMAPDIIRGKGYSLPVDWWAVGILLYELLSGRPPFDAAEEEEIFRLVARGHVLYPPAMERDAKDLIVRLLLPDPSRRLGGRDSAAGSVQGHAFFAAIDWEEAGAGRLEPPWLPQVQDPAADTSLFDHFEESTEGAVDSCTASSLLAPEAELGELFAAWQERLDFRADALALVAELRRQREQRQAAREAERQQEPEEALADSRVAATAPPPEPRKAQRPQCQPCCTAQ